MILLLGASGYIGRAFANELHSRNRPFIPLSRRELNYGRFDLLLSYLRETRPEFLINCAGYTGSPNIDACETARAETLTANALLPHTIAQACAATQIPWGHVSSGCIFNGAKIVRDGGARVVPDLNAPDVRELLAHSPGMVQGFAETDPPNFSFRSPPCSFYSGSKALGEEAARNAGQSYIWRMRMPFDAIDHPRNYLSKLQRYSKLTDVVNSISHRGDFARACLDLWERRAPFGIYNITNPGFVSSRQVVDLIQRILKPARSFEFVDESRDHVRLTVAPRTNCILDTSKVLDAGVFIRPVMDAVEDSLRNWKPEGNPSSHAIAP